MSADSASLPARLRPRVRRVKRNQALAVLTAVVLTGALAACGSDEPASSGNAATATTGATAGGFPVTVIGSNGRVVLETQPETIVSLSPTATEMLFAIGAGAQVTAVDDQSTYPTDAPKTDLSGFKPNAEAIAKYDPDLVVLATDANGIVSSLATLGIKVLQLPDVAKVEQAYTQLGILGAATGHQDDASKVIADTQSRLAQAVASMPPTSKGQRVYHELDPTYYSATSATFVGDVYTMLGLSNVADDAKGASGGYPQLSAEFVVKADPDLIVLADGKCCQQDAASVAKRPGFDATSAVKNDMVIAVDDDIASRWGPRVADFAEAVAAAFQ